MRPPAGLQGRLDELSDLPVNYDVDALDLDDPPSGWTVDDRSIALPSEQPGQPVAGGPWEIASRLIRGYEFADPSLVRAYYDPDAPLDGRNMLLALTALRLVTVHVGVRVAVVQDDVEDGARVFGWAYRTLQGHVEQGQMGWQVRKVLSTGEVEFRSHAVSRTAQISNPIIRLGFPVVKGYERGRYLNSNDRRMRELTKRALQDESVAEASSELTVRGGTEGEAVHEELADRLREP